jgi:ABC-type uncharacterized transport system substrate-binding protein
MTRLSPFKTLLLALALLVPPSTAQAHPHVWVVVKSELVLAADGRVSAIRHAWTFDEMFSAFATQGLDQNKDGKFSREELAELAETNVTSLKEFNYFSVAKSGSKDVTFGEPTDYWLEADKDNVLTLHFTLPVQSGAVKSGIAIEIFDPTWFVDLSLAEEGPIVLVGAPAGCAAEGRKPKPPATGASSGLSESFFNSLTAASQFGSQFANRIILSCK